MEGRPRPGRWPSPCPSPGRSAGSCRWLVPTQTASGPTARNVGCPATLIRPAPAAVLGSVRGSMRRTSPARSLATHTEPKPRATPGAGPRAATPPPGWSAGRSGDQGVERVGDPHRPVVGGHVDRPAAGLDGGHHPVGPGVDPGDRAADQAGHPDGVVGHGQAGRLGPDGHGGDHLVGPRVDPHHRVVPAGPATDPDRVAPDGNGVGGGRPPARSPPPGRRRGRSARRCPTWFVTQSAPPPTAIAGGLPAHPDGGQRRRRPDRRRVVAAGQQPGRDQRHQQREGGHDLGAAAAALGPAQVVQAAEGVDGVGAEAQGRRRLAARVSSSAFTARAPRTGPGAAPAPPGRGGDGP